MPTETKTSAASSTSILVKIVLFLIRDLLLNLPCQPA
jgi:hypothetical protein